MNSREALGEVGDDVVCDRQTRVLWVDGHLFVRVQASFDDRLDDDLGVLRTGCVRPDCKPFHPSLAMSAARAASATASA